MSADCWWADTKTYLQNVGGQTLKHICRMLVENMKESDWQQAVDVPLRVALHRILEIRIIVGFSNGPS